MSDLTQAVQAILDNQDEYIRAENYYYGTVDEIFASKRVKRALAEAGSGHRVNYAATPVNAVANRLEVTGVTTLSAEAESVIDQTWQLNNLELELTQLITKTLVYGSAYVICWPDESGDVQIYYNSPLSTVVLYDPETPRKPLVAAKLWTIEVDGKPRSRLNLFYADRIEKYISKAPTLPMNVKDTDFDPFGEDSIVPNEFGVIPVFHFTTGIDQYGRPEHINAYGPQDAINKLLVSQLASIEYYGFPQRWALQGEHTGTPSDWDETADDTEALSNEPGSFLWLQNVIKVGQFTPADPKTYIEPFREQVRTMASVTDTPFHVFEAVATNVSGEAVRAAEAPLVKKVRTRQLAIGNALRKLFLFVLKLNGIEEDVQIQWRQVESIDESEKWTIAYKKIQAGLPVEQVLLEQGYDVEKINEWKDNGQLNMRIRPAESTNLKEGESVND